MRILCAITLRYIYVQLH